MNHLKKNIHSTYVNRITIITLFLSILFTFNTLNFQSIGKGISLYSGLFQITVQSHMVEILLLIVGISILYSWPFLISTQNKTLENSSVQTQEVLSIEKSDQYSLIAIFSILGGSLLMSSLDLLSMYLSIELQSFALYILATLNKERLSATSAGLKYFLLGSLSSCFILLGAAIIYSYTGLTQFEAINSLMSILAEKNKLIEQVAIDMDINKAFTIGIIIMLIGFLFKISAAPFYQWAPDVYDGTPTIVTVWLTIVVKITILIFLLSFFEFTLPRGLNSVGTLQVKNLLLISSLLSLLIGTVAGLSQIKVKRLLAFSSISHVGFLLLALGVYTQKSVDSFIFYLIQYTITSLNIFLILLAFGYLIINSEFFYSISREADILGQSVKQVVKIEVSQGDQGKLKVEGTENTDINYLIELKGQLYNNPILSISLAICLFSMAGIPPLIGFFSKQFVLFSSIENGNNFLSIIAILVSVISASYYLRLIKITFFEESGENHFKEKDKKVVLHLTNIHSYIISILTFIILFFFLDPTILLNGTQLISLTIFNI